MSRKPSITRQQAHGHAAAYLAAQDLKGWRLEIAEVRRALTDGMNWTVVADRFSPEGVLVDGPQILIVNGRTGEVRTFEAFYE